jgi:acylphosphatase
MTTGVPAVRWVVRGRVQGVGFRWFTARTARGLGVEGWVRNLPDGAVEVFGRGNPAALEALEQAIKAGPAGANVESVEKSDIPHQAIPDNAFEIR